MVWKNFKRTTNMVEVKLLKAIRRACCLRPLLFFMMPIYANEP